LPASSSVNRATVAATGRGLSLVTTSGIFGLLLRYGNDIGGVGGPSRTSEIRGVSVVIATETPRIYSRAGVGGAAGTGRNDSGTRRA
jgi:hypothetical protein